MNQPSVTNGIRKLVHSSGERASELRPESGAIAIEVPHSVTRYPEDGFYWTHRWFPTIGDFHTDILKWHLEIGRLLPALRRHKTHLSIRSFYVLFPPEEEAEAVEFKLRFC